jgi:hypothetical protein
MLNKFLIVIVFLSTQLLLLNTVHSDVYKWVDENGNVVYGDKPTSNNADKIKIKSPPQADKPYQKRYKKQQKLLSVMQEERDEKIELKKEEQEKNKKQKEKCNEIIKELQGIKNAGFLFEATDDPFNPEIISDKKRNEQEKKHAQYIKENCL